MSKTRLELIGILSEYVELLSEELKDVSGIASVHGWESTRYKKGAELRLEIGKLEEKLKKEEK